MEKIKELVNSSLTKCVVSIGIGVLLLMKKDVLYAGVAFGIGIREFFLAFKKECGKDCQKNCCLK